MCSVGPIYYGPPLYYVPGTLFAFGALNPQSTLPIWHPDPKIRAYYLKYRGSKECEGGRTGFSNFSGALTQSLGAVFDKLQAVIIFQADAIS